MSQSARTPESLLPRSDSRNPASTCRGITVNGKPCRRAIASSIQSAHAKNAFVSRLEGQSQQFDQSVFYCWQHKNQAATAIDASKERKQERIATLAGKTSIDSLVDRLEILDVNDDQPGAPTHNNRPNGSSEREKSRSNQRGSSFCCFNYVDDTNYLPATKRVTNSAPGYASYEKRVASRPSTPSQRPVFVRDPRARVAPVVQQRPTPMTPQRWFQSPQQSTPRSSDRLPYRSSPATAPPSPSKWSSLPNTPNSGSLQTRLLMSLIPGHLSPQTTALLLTELSKPISHEDEDGYIYIFWVTPEKSSPDAAPPGREIALNLLPTADRPHDSRRTSDALRAAKSVDPHSKGTGTIRLKIGRASNVHRRLAEWSKQCAHNLTLIRYYPYTKSSSTSSPARSTVGTPNSGNSQIDARRVPHVHRVERLIHIELADQRVKGEGPCGHCNKEHREWFEITATRDALKLVDDCVRRWVAWGERGR